MARVAHQLLIGLAAAGVATALALGADSPAGSSSHRNVSGTWVRDQRASDDPVDKMDAAGGAGGGAGGGQSGSGPKRRRWGVNFPGGVWWPGGGGGGGTRGGGGGTGPYGGGPPGGGGPGGGSGGPYGGQPGGGGGGRGGGSGSGGHGGQSGGSMARDRAVHLARGIEAWQIDYRDPELTIRDANRETRVLFTDGRVVGDGVGTKTIASWRGDRLEIETQGALGSMRETWTLDPDGTRLTVDSQVDLGRAGDFNFRTVYDREQGDDAGTVKTADLGAPSAPGASAPSASPAPDLPSSASPGPGSPPDRTAPAEPSDDYPHAQSSYIRLLPPLRPNNGGLLSGKVTFDTLTIDSSVVAVEFYLDGERVAHRAWPPFEAKIALANPPREQTVRAVALAVGDRVLGEDQMVVNRLDPPFRVHVASIQLMTSGNLEVRADVSTPRRAELERLAFYVGDTQIAEVQGPPFVAKVEPALVQPEAYVRVVATLRDGREREDVALLDPKTFVENVDVRMVELQLIVTDHTGTAVGGLAAEDFEIVEGSKTLKPEHLYPAERVGLLLGLAIDSSGSMWPLWDQTRAAATYFLDHTLQPRDRAFLVDFDSELRLVEPPTSDREMLAWGFDRMSPHGGTALYDSILFSMLQYQGESGRRALIVVTDGLDSESRSDPRRTIEFGRRLGIPVYVIALSGAPGGPPRAGLPQSTLGTGAAVTAEARNQLRVITDPTGGRMFHVVTPDQMARAFAEIQEELHRQYVLTYYTERPPGEGGAPEVKIKRSGLEVRSAVPLEVAQ